MLGLLPLSFAFAPRSEQVLVLGIGEGRGGLGWAAGGRPQLSFWLAMDKKEAKLRLLVIA